MIPSSARNAAAIYLVLLPRTIAVAITESSANPSSTVRSPVTSSFQVW